MYTEINPKALLDKKGHSSSIQTVKGFYVVLEDSTLKNIE